MTDVSAPVSVIIPCYLCQHTIERAVLSVVRQTLLPSEVLLIDDASPDDGATVLELRRLAEKHKDMLAIRVVLSLTNGGPGSARNRGWELASQPYISFLDADDVWFPRKIECQYAWMHNHPEYFLTCHKQVLIDEKVNQIENQKFCSDNVTFQNISRRKILYFNVIATRTVMLRRELLYRFVEGKRYSEDYLLWLMIVLSGLPSAKLDWKLAAAFKPEFGSTGLSSNLTGMALGELDCYLKLYRLKMIGVLSVLVSISFSLMRFIRRVFIIGFRIFD